MFNRLKRLFDRFQPLLVIAAMFLLLGIAMALVVGAPLAGQAPAPTIRADSAQATSTGYAVQLYYTTPPRDSLVVVKRLDAGKESLVARYAASTVSASYSRKVTMSSSATGLYTFTARRYVGAKLADSAAVAVQVGPVPTPAPAPAPTLAILSADTTISTRTAGDTTFTTRRIITTRGLVDTASSETFVVVPTVTVLRADSVTLAGWGLASYDTTHYVTGNFRVYPLTMPGYVNMRWLLNGNLVGTSSQVQHYSTARFPRPAAGTYQLVGCARVQGQLATTPDVCSKGYPLTIGRLAGDTVATTTPAADSSYGFASLGIGPMLTDSFIPAAWRPHGADTLRFPVALHWAPPAGMTAGVRVTFAERSDTVWRAIAPADSIPLPVAIWAPASAVSALIPIRRPASGGTLTVSVMAYIVGTDGLGRAVAPLTTQYVEP